MLKEFRRIEIYERLDIKRKRAFGGYLGTGRRRRTCESAISYVELTRGVDAWMSEWGNLPRVVGSYDE